MATSITEEEWCSLPVLCLTVGKATARVSPLGARILQWAPLESDERLYLTPPPSTEGGISAILPWGEALQNEKGILTHLSWRIVEQKTGVDFALVVFRLTHSDLPSSLRSKLSGCWWIEETVSLDPHRLDVELAIGNTGSDSILLTCSLATYLLYRSYTTLQGLSKLPYLDLADGRKQKIDDAPLLTLPRSINRAYLSPLEPILLNGNRQQLAIMQEQFSHCLIRNQEVNPKDANHPSQVGEYFLCVEAVQLTPLILTPGNEWLGRQSLLLNL